MVAVRDRGGVNAGHHILAVLREAPPLLFGLVGRHAVDCFYIQTVLGFFAFDKLLLLQCLAQNRGRVVPVRTIYETVWHETYMPASNNTVMVHIVNLRKKLEEDPANPRLIRTVWGKGYQID